MANEVSVGTDGDIREQAAQHTLAANPLVGVRGQDILDSARLLLGQILSHPFAATQQYLTLLAELGRIATGASELAPDAKDRRFADPAWRESVAYRSLAQSYLAWGSALYRFLDEAKLDKRDAERARFVVSLLVDAMSPIARARTECAPAERGQDSAGTPSGLTRSPPPGRMPSARAVSSSRLRNVSGSGPAHAADADFQAPPGGPVIRVSPGPSRSSVDWRAAAPATQ